MLSCPAGLSHRGCASSSLLAAHTAQRQCHVPPSCSLQHCCAMQDGGGIRQLWCRLPERRQPLSGCSQADLRGFHPQLHNLQVVTSLCRNTRLWGGHLWLRRSQEGCCPVDMLLASAAGHQECMQPVSAVESVQRAASRSDDCCLGQQDVALCTEMHGTQRSSCRVPCSQPLLRLKRAAHIYWCCMVLAQHWARHCGTQLLLVSCMLLLSTSRRLPCVCAAARPFMMSQCHAAGSLLCA